MQIEEMPVIAATDEPLPDWCGAAARSFVAELGDPAYPCHFGRAALRRRELFVTFFEESTAPLAAVLTEFLTSTREHLSRRMALAAFRRPEAQTRDERWYADRFWQILQDLHDRDDQPWPADMPSDPDDPRWEFCFRGVPMFVFAAAPSYQDRRSRHLGSGLVLLFQPRNVFAGVEGGTPAGMRARQLIRARTLAWDARPPHPDLGDYGDPSNHEWRQYFTADDDSRLDQRCPLRMRRGVTP